MQVPDLRDRSDVYQLLEQLGAAPRLCFKALAKVVKLFFAQIDLALLGFCDQLEQRAKDFAKALTWLRRAVLNGNALGPLRR